MTSNLSFLSDNAAYLPHPRLVDERLREMFEAARSEAENFGVLAAVVSCTLNDMNDAGASLVPNFVLGFIPSDPILLQNLRRLAGGCIPAGLDTHIEFLNAQIEVAKKLLRGSVEERKSFLTLHEIDQLAHAWRGVCDHVIVVMAGLDALLPEVGGGSSQIDRFQLENGLVNARDGGSDLSLKRDFNFPSWAQKRRHRRVLLNDIGKAKVKGRTRTVLITDASAGGLGLDFTEGFEQGERITVILSTGRLFLGQVVWSAGTRAGVQFDQELSQNDILFSWESC
ncbi:MAG: PilZ domain-containing protein [Alphaproteobacteria bacterium]|nr:PilZ domain-containing protein [Alphaproteobacteria bacterium]